MDKQKKPWFKRWWAIVLWVFLGTTFLIALFGDPDAVEKQAELTRIAQQEANNPPIDLEMSTNEIFDIFSGLTELQQQEKMKEFKGKRIKTSIYASKIDQASLSSQYVVMEMYEYPYNLLPYAKAFFPSGEKDKLLNVNIGDTIVFSGKFVSYQQGGLTSTIEFTDSRFIEVEKK